jgi:hypothetical protein
LANNQHIEFQAQQFLAQEKDVCVFQYIVYKQPCEGPITEESAKMKVGKTVVLRDKPYILEVARRVWGSRASFVYEDILTPRDPATIDG